jgi:hypothetical protein
MNQLAYSTATGDRSRGWDAFDRMIAWALTQRPRQTVEDIAQLLPPGISYYLIRRALETAVADGTAARIAVRDGEPRYETTHSRPSGYLAA